MLSILIPTYNYNIYPLVASVFEQCQACKIIFEIICYDDGSTKCRSENNQINQLKNAQYLVLEKNIGRSAIRNKLAQDASFEHLLFLDADTLPVDDFFVKNYLKHLDGSPKIVYGGIKYQEEKPEKEALLRWVYGIEREALGVENRNKNPYLSFLTLNFLIHKSIFETVRFNEEIPNLRHEDTLFSFNLKQKNIPLLHIHNPVYHLGLEDSVVFLQKSEEALVGLKYLLDAKLLDFSYLKIATMHQKLKAWRIIFALNVLFKIINPLLKKQLLGKKPNLFLFDMYRLGYLCGLE